jgi:DNA-binding SARP family transcriptional activator
MWRVHLLGGLKIAWAGDPVLIIPGRAARSLLAYLVTHRDRAHARDHLAGLYWPELPDRAARRRLSQALWQIRHTLQTRSRGGTLLPSDPPVLLTEGDSVQLNPDIPLWLDVEEFEQGVMGSRESGSPEITPRLLAAVDLYRGEFLQGTYDDWAVPERERLRELLLEALGRLVKVYKGWGEHERALVFARRLAAEDPWREGAHREVMRLCHLLGQDAAAIRQFEVCRQALAEDLGVEPSSETASLAAEIARLTGLPQPPLVPVPAREVAAPLLERPDRLPLVGRGPELAELLRQVEAAAAGDGGLALVYGEAGVGKSRLLRELADNAEWRGMPSVWGRCYELVAPPAYQPVVEALREGLPALNNVTLPPLWRAELSRLLPELQSTELPPPALSAQDDQRRLLEAIVQAFLALSKATPHLVLLEDVHWIDLASLEALRYLLPRLNEAALLFVLTVRSEELVGQPEAGLHALERTRLPRRLELRRLDREETAKLVQRALGLEQPAPRFGARLYAETEGNPFFVLETLWALVEEGMLHRSAMGDWSTPWDESTEDYAELPLPLGVVQSIERRLARLPEGRADLLNIAVVSGREVSFEVWRRASGWEEDALLEAADGLCGRGLLLAGKGGADYVFAHDMIRRVAYERLAPPRRRLYHRRVAQALADLASGEPAALAYHWTQAEVWDRAVECHWQAGDRARSVYAHAEAADHYSQALEALEALYRQTGLPDLARRFELHLAREGVLALEGKRAEQASDLEELAALAEQLEDDQRRIAVTLQQGKYYTEISDWPTALEHVERALSLTRAIGDREREASGLAFLSRVYGNLGDFAASLSHREEALAVFRALGNRQQEARSLSACGTLHMVMGHHALAQDCCERAMVLCRATGDQRGEAVSLYTLSRTLATLGDLASAREHIQQALNIAQATGDRYREAYYRLEVGNHNYRLGDYPAARDSLEEANTIFLQIGETRGHGYALADQGLVYHALGDDKMALDCCRRGQELLRTIGDRWGEVGCFQHLGLVMEGLGDLDSAAGMYRQGSALNEEIEQPVRALDNRLGLARVALAQGRVAGALELVEDVAARIGAEGIQGLEFPFIGYMTVYQVHVAAGDKVRARAVLTEAYGALMDRAEKLKDPAIRDQFLENVAVHRELVAAYRGLEATEQVRRITLSLPRADAPLGRPLRDDEFVAVNWTLESSEDARLSGKVARRRARILRLLREAQDQGAAPRDEDLAGVLEVSLRTLRRDMAALRDQGHSLPTRWRKMST